MFVKKFVAKIIDCRIVYSFAVKYIAQYKLLSGILKI